MRLRGEMREAGPILNGLAGVEALVELLLNPVERAKRRRLLKLISA
jgi:hypothetical protein